ncbi:amino acid adenylation domain-containing protein [Brevibacillus ruminantium]|uniref:Amino acid adenylation domain-containing protein n=1 Tax=Brevibacillus ruminantium TaxID=2950604 RepID=A0ABY4WPK8_9BACL|nr:non-ribosomal peptide synthetase [Brevibacillus ruminantium]USG66581.1 amino acid adenylation domain-containing protein [Brevibacillus ruminantium]
MSVTKMRGNRMYTEQFPNMEACIHHLIEQQVEIRPDQTAVIYEETALTYRELNEKANQFAHYLVKCGLSIEDPVAVCMDRSLEMVIVLLGVLKAGGAYVPMDPEYPQKRLEYMLTDAKAPVIVTSKSREALFAGQCLGDTKLIVVDHREEWSGQQKTNLTIPLTVDNLIYIIYTSGSTGNPKGVMNTHRALNNRLQWKQKVLQLDEKDRVLQKTTFSFDVSVWEFFWPLLAGATLVVARPGEHRDPAYLIQTIQEQSITTIHFVPSMLQIFLDAYERDIPLPSLKRVICGGEALPKAMERAFFSKFDTVELHNLYGPTEAAIDVTYWRCTGDEQETVIPIGFPISNISLYILDEAGNPITEPGVAGELHIGGIGLARGYYNKPELTEEKFIPNPFEEGGRLYKTGDLCRYREDWAIEYLGRIDFQVKIRGFRIELGEIEAELERLPGIKQCVVSAITEENHTYLAAYMSVQDSEKWDENYVRQQLEEVLPDYMIPSFFVRLDAFPLSSNGKVDRKSLPSPWKNRMVPKDALPTTLTEKKVASLWKELLFLGEVSIHTPFLSAGGNSLFAARLVSRIKQQLQIPISLRDVFSHPTIHQLANWIDSLSVPSGELSPLKVKPTKHREKKTDLSFAQKRLWFIHEWQDTRSMYNLPNYFEINGPLKHDVLRASLEELLARHESLRANFITENGHPYQVIDDSRTSNLEWISLLDQPYESARQAALQQMEEDARIPFDLSADPLYRFKLFQLSEDQYLFYFHLHHIISDGWSSYVFQSDLFKLYNELEGGMDCSDRTDEERPEAAVQYRDYINWEQAFVDSPEYQEQLAYWKTQLNVESPALKLVASQNPSYEQGHEGDVSTFRIPPQVIEQLQNFCKQHHSTLYAAMLSVFTLMIYRLSHEKDIAIGTTAVGRNHAELEKLIGFFVNTLVIRNQIREGSSFVELLQQVSDTAVQAFSHGDVPFDKVVEEIQPHRSVNQSPLFSHMFSFQDFAFEPVEAKHLTVGEPILLHNQTAKFDLTLFMERSGDTYIGKWEYRTDLYPEETMKRFTSHFLQLCREVLEHPSQPVEQLSLLTEEEKALVLHRFNETECDFPDVGLHEWVEAQVQRTPNHIAAEYEGECLTYRELDEKANQLAHLLREKGVKPDTPVGVCMERSLELLVSIMGILKAGGAYLPIDTETPWERANAMLQDAQASICITQPGTNMKAGHGIELLSYLIHGNLLDGYPATKPDVPVTPDHLVSIYYTSGSTGKPKGVSNTHKGWVNRLNWMQKKHRLAEHEVVLQKTILTFDDAAVEIFWPLLVGAKIAFLPKGAHRDPVSIIEYAIRHNVSLLQFVPSMLKMVLEQITPQQKQQLTNLRIVVSSGEALHADVVRSFYEKLPGRLYNTWGATEVSIDSTCFDCEPHQENSSEIVSVGRPIDNNRIYVLDSFLKPLPPGVPGDLYIAGIGLARGYINNPERTSQSFLPDPFYPGENMYLTGDRGYLNQDGSIMFLGRQDNQIKLRGMRVELGEIETTLRSIDGISDAVVTVHNTESGIQYLAAYYTSTDGPMEPGRLKHALKKGLPDYMVPGYYVPLETFPLNANGKIDRHQLPKPTEEHLAVTGAYVAPKNEKEQAIVSIWLEKLGVQKIGTQDHFFELGGHSLLAVQIISAINQRFGAKLYVKDLFEHPTVETLAEVLDRRLSRDADKLVFAQADRNLPSPLSDAQKRLWFLDQLHQDTKYNMPLVLKFQGSVDAKRVTDCLNQLIARHESLRTAFHHANGEPQQSVLPEASLTLQVEEWDQQDLQRIVQREMSIPFDLSVAPLVRGRLVKGKAADVLILVFHHIISDGWSLQVIMDELLQLYAGETSFLATPPVQYLDYVTAQNQFTQQSDYQEQLFYWQKKFEGELPLLQLPHDRNRQKEAREGNNTLKRSLSQQAAADIKAFSQAKRVTPFMTMLSVFGLLLSRLSRQRDLIIGTPIVNRNAAELEKAVGLYLNTLPLRLILDEQVSYQELLQQTKQTVLEAFAHQDISFEKIVEVVNPKRNLNRNPLFDVLINYRNFEEIKQSHVHNLNVEKIELDEIESKFFMTLYIEETADSFQLSLAYQNHLFEQGRMEEFLNQYVHLLGQVIRSTDQVIESYSLVTPEAGSILPDPTASLRCQDYPRITHCIRRWSEAIPDHIAVEGTERSYSYQELYRDALRVAKGLRKRNVGSGDVVALYGDRSYEMIAAMIGVHLADAVFMNIDARMPAKKMESILHIAKPRLMVVMETLDSMHSHVPANAELPCYQIGELIGDQAVEREDLLPEEVCPHAYIFFTSGTTGEPKGILGTHTGLAHFLDWQRMQFSVTPADRSAQLTHITFDVYLRDVFLPLTSGATLVLPAHQETEVVRWLAEKEITLLHAVPSLADHWLKQSPQDEFSDTLRHIFFAGEPLPGALVRSWREVTDAQINNFYGQTETTLAKCFHIVPDQFFEEIMPIGKPIPDTQLLVVNQQNQLCGVGEQGEIVVRTPYRTRGYLDQGVDTFIQSFFREDADDLLYRTGDIGCYRPDGNLEIHGRVDDQLKIRGIRIHKNEIAAAILRQAHTKQCVIIEKQEADQILLQAYIVMEEGQLLQPDQLRKALRQDLPLAMIPNRFIQIDQVPVTANGKVDRKKLASYQAVVESREHDQFQNSVELELEKIWLALLPVSSIGPNSNFFECGGHSLLIVKMISRIRELLGYETSLLEVFEYPTIRELAARLQTKKKKTDLPIQKVTRVRQKL